MVLERGNDRFVCGLFSQRSQPQDLARITSLRTKARSLPPMNCVPWGGRRSNSLFVVLKIIDYFGCCKTQAKSNHVHFELADSVVVVPFEAIVYCLMPTAKCLFPPGSRGQGPGSTASGPGSRLNIFNPGVMYVCVCVRCAGLCCCKTQAKSVKITVKYVSHYFPAFSVKIPLNFHFLEN